MLNRELFILSLIQQIAMYFKISMDAGRSAQHGRYSREEEA